MKHIVIAGILVLLAACSSNDPETVKKKIIAKKEQISRIQKQVNTLELRYDELMEGNGDKFLTPVKVKEIAPETFKSYINVSGNIEALEYAAISPEIGGRVKAIHVKEGEWVKKGQVLVSLNTDAFEGQLVAAKSSLELADSTYNKQKALWEQKIGSEIQYLNTKSLKESLEAQVRGLQAQMNMAGIKAPFDGIVDNISIKVGEITSPGFPVVEVVNLSQLKIIADLSESYLPHIKQGKQIEVTIPTYPDMVINVPVYRTSNIINPANRTFQVEVRLDNRNGKIKPNMVAILKINDLTIDNAMIVPSIIIKKDIQKTESGNFKEFLFIADETDSLTLARKVYVVSGEVYNNEAVITSGLQKGQKVIVEGFNTVSTGTEIKIVK